MATANTHKRKKGNKSTASRNQVRSSHHLKIEQLRNVKMRQALDFIKPPILATEQQQVQIHHLTILFCFMCPFSCC